MKRFFLLLTMLFLYSMNLLAVETINTNCGSVVTSIMPSGSRTDASNINRSSIIAFDYDHRGEMGNFPTPTQLASAGEVGTVWGKAYNANSKKLYAAAFLRRHADLSPDGLGAIYEIDVTTQTPTLWMNLNSATHLGSSATLFPSETAANRGLSSPFAPSHDVWAYSRVAKEGIGGLDLSDDFKKLYAMDMTNRQLLEIDTASKSVSNRYSITNPGCSGGAGDVRPFGVDYINGDVYIGVTCSGETNKNDNDVNAYVMKLTGSIFTPVVSGATGFRWVEYWDDDPYAYGSSCGNFKYSLKNGYVPLITNMEIDSNGNMVIGVMGRNGFRFGEGNYVADTGCTSLITNHESRGFVLHATPSGSNWVLSSDEIWNTDNGDPQHHYKDGILAHWGSPGASKTYVGGMAKTDCSGQEVIITNLMDALDYETAGTRFMRTSDAQQEAATNIGDTDLATSTASTTELYAGSGNSWQKSAGLGDIEYLVAPSSSPPSTPTPIAEFRFDDCGGDEWKTDYSATGNNAIGNPSIISNDFKTNMCNSIENDSWDVNIPDHTAYDIDEGTISIMLYDNHTVWANARLIGKGWDASNQLLMEIKDVGGDSHKGTISVNLSGNTIDTGETFFTTLNNGTDDNSQWTHITFTFGSSGMKLYINGVLKGSNAYTGGINGIPGDISMPAMSGYFDEFYMFDGQMSDAEVSNLYSNVVANKNIDGTDRDCGCGSNLTPLGCQPSAWLLNDTKDLYEQNMTSTSSTQHTNALVEYANGIGYNKTDGFVWGYVNTDSTEQMLIKIGKDSNGSYASELLGPILGVAGQPDLPLGTGGSKAYINIGDVNAKGELHLLYRKNTHLGLSGEEDNLYVIDLNSSSTNYQKVIDHTIISNGGNGLPITDWAFHPLNGKIYAISTSFGGTATLFEIDPASGYSITSHTINGLNTTNDINYEAFFDDKGFFYAYTFQEGEVYSIDLSDPTNPASTASFFATVPTGSGGDTARCAKAPMPVIHEAKLLAEYHFDECLWNGTAGEVKDSSGNGFDGIALTGANTDINNGQINGSGKFVDNYDAVKVEGITGLNSNDFTVSFWTKIDADGSATHELLKLENVNASSTINGDGGVIELRYRESDDELRVSGEREDGSGGVNGYSQTVTADLNDGNWHHIVLTYTNENMKIYVDTSDADMIHPANGISGVSNLGVLDDFNGVLRVGNSINGLFNTKVNIDEVKLYDGALSSDQISTIHTNETLHKNANGTIRPIVNCSTPLTPFTCDETLYISNRNILGTGSEDGNNTWLHTVDKNATPYSYSAIGNEYLSSADGYNALGYNIKDNFMYALDGNHLLKIDKNATVQDLGVVTGLDPQQLYAGEFDRDGFFYVSGNGVDSPFIYKIDINSTSLIDTIVMSRGSKPASVRFWDMAIDETGDYFYVMLVGDGDADSDYNNDKFAKINKHTGVITEIGADKSSMSSYISLIFSDKDGDVFIMSNEDGFYKVNTSNGDVYELSLTQDLTLYNDGTSCPDANISEPPSMVVNDVTKEEGDSGLTTFTFTVVLNKPALPNSGFWFSLTDGVDAVAPIETAAQIPGIDDDYKGNSGYLTIPTGSTQLDIPVSVVGDTKMEHNEEFYLDLYAPTNLIIEDNRGVGTIINDDLVHFNVERTNSDTVDNATQIQKESLYTQIVGRDFNYAVVAYDKNQTNHSEANIEDVTLKIELFDNNTTKSNKLLYKNYVYFSLGSPQSRFNVTPIMDLQIPNATRYAQYKISYLLDGNGSIIYGQYDNENDYNTTRIGAREESTLSKDSFAIRPASYRIKISDNNVSNLQSNNITTTINLAAEHDYNLSVHATKYASENIALDYNVLNSEIDATLILKNKNTLVCDKENDPKLNCALSNGTLITGNTLSHNNVGEYTLYMRDINWTAIDQNSNSLFAGCIPNTSTISLTGETKSGCNIESNLSTTLASYLPKHYNIDIDFEAYGFDVSSISLLNRPNNAKNYIYMSDLHDNTGMGIQIEGDIIAKGEKGSTLTNFTQSCMAKDVEILLDHNITTDQGTFSNSAVAFQTTKGTSLQSSMIIEHNGIGTGTGYQSLHTPISVQKQHFLDPSKGSSHLSILYNIQKSLHETTNPIRVDFFSFDANATTARSMVNNKEWYAQGETPLGKNKYFYFSRLAPEMENYNRTFEASMRTPVSIEIFCEHNRSWCTDMIGTNGRNNANTQEGWYRTHQHDILTDGKIFSFIPDDPNIKVTQPNNVTYMDGRYVNVVTQNLTPNTSTVVQVDINASSWLNYHPIAVGGIPFWKNTFTTQDRPEFSGIGKTSYKLDINRSIKPAHRLSW